VPSVEAGACEEAPGEELDVVAMGADEEDPLGQVHAGFRWT
jgi:hypothetical protein